MKRHEWFDGFDWDKLQSEKMIPYYKPNIAHDRTDVKTDTIRQAVMVHDNAPFIADTDQHLFKRYNKHLKNNKSL